MPEQDLRWLKRMVAVVNHRPPATRNKQAMLRPTHELIEAEIRLMDEAEAWIGRNPRRRAVHHRNGLSLAFLAARPLRGQNFCSLKVGRHLVRDGDGWRIVLDASETKAANRIELPLPTDLVPYLDRILSAGGRSCSTAKPLIDCGSRYTAARSTRTSSTYCWAR